MSVGTFEARFGQATQSVRSGKIAGASSSTCPASVSRAVAKAMTTSAAAGWAILRAPSGSGSSNAAAPSGGSTSAYVPPSPIPSLRGSGVAE